MCLRKYLVYLVFSSIITMSQFHNECGMLHIDFNMVLYETNEGASSVNKRFLFCL